LCSKTYYCFGKEDKFSCKGINKGTNQITKVHGCSVVEEVWIQYRQRVPLNGQPGIYILPGEEWLLVLLRRGKVNAASIYRASHKPR
jgi:hypothetical protein